jgi:trehalose 6-phosphate phosphatase
MTQIRDGSCSAHRTLPEARANWAFFLDIDGTLVGFADTPAEVAVDSVLKQTLDQLYTQTGGAVALISGRSIAQVDRLFAPLLFPTSGQHGAERRSPSGVLRHYAVRSPQIEAIKQRLVPLTVRHPRLVLEDKGLTLAVHYRRVPQLAGYLHRFLRRSVNSVPNLCLQPGNMVLEIKPAARDKGSTIMDFMAEKPYCGREPVFIGDDVTDEYGFSVINDLGGHSFKVGPGRTVAQWRFRDHHAVRNWLERCANDSVAARARSTP